MNSAVDDFQALHVEHLEKWCPSYCPLRAVQSITRRQLPTTGLHLAPFVTFVFGSVGMRSGISLSEPDGTGPGIPGPTQHGSEVGLVLTARLPAQGTSKGALEPRSSWD